MRRPNSIPRAVAFPIAILSTVIAPLPQGAKAAISEWNGTDAGGLWNSTTYWSSGIPGGLGTLNHADVATFRTGSGRITVDASRNIHSLNFAATAGAFMIGGTGPNQGEALRLSHGGTLSMAQGSTVTQIIEAPLILEAANATSNGSYTFSNLTFAADNSNAAPSTSATTPKLWVKGNISGGNTTGSITLTLAGTVGTRNANHGNLASNQAFEQANTLSGVISDGGAQGGLTIQVDGNTSNNSNRYNAWNLTGLNTYSGSTVVKNGALYFNTLYDQGVASSLGTGLQGDIQLGSGFLMYTGGATSTNRTIRGMSGSFHNHGSGAITLNGSVITSAGIIFRGQHSFIINGLITGSSTVGNNGGTLRTLLNNNQNSFTGDLVIFDGTVSVGTVANRGGISAMGMGNNVQLGQQNTNVGNFEYTGAVTGFTDRTFKLATSSVSNGGNGKISVMGAGSLYLTDKIQGATTDATHAGHIELSGTGHGVVEGFIGGTSTTAEMETNLRLTKSGTGTWELQNVSYIYGNVAVNAGRLLVNNTNFGSGTGSGNVTVSGTGILGGNGIVAPKAGQTFTLSSTGSLMVGNTHGVALGESQGNYFSESGAISIGLGENTAINLQGNVLFDLFANLEGWEFSESDRLFISTAAETVNVQGAVIQLSNQSGSTGWTSGSWQLVDWGGSTATGNVTYALDRSALARGYEWDTSQFLTDGSVSIAKHSYFWMGLGSSTSIGDTANWDTSGLPPDGSAGISPAVRDVIFGAVTQGASTTASWTGDRRVVNIYFTDADTNYHIGPAASGATLYTFGNTLENDGGSHVMTATLRLRGVEDVFTIKNEGSLDLRGSFMFSRADGGNATRTLVFDGSGTTAVASIQTRSPGEILHVRKMGSGVTTISGYSNQDPTQGNYPGAYIGKTSILDGKLRIHNELSVGRAYATHTPDQLTINGGTLGAFGTFSFANKNRGITIGSEGGTIDVENHFIMTVDTQMVGTGNLTKTGTGTLELLENQSNWTRNIYVNQGVLRVSNSEGSATGSASVIVNSGGTLSGGGSITGSSSASITLGAGTALVVGNHHAGAAVKSDLLLGSKDSINAVDLQLQTILKFDLFGAGLSADWGDTLYNDLLNVENDLLVLSTLGDINLSQAKIELASANTADWDLGQIWKLIDWSNSNFANIDTTGLALMTTSLGGFTLEQRITSDGLYVQVVPEPQRALLMLGALGAFAFRRKRL